MGGMRKESLYRRLCRVLISGYQITMTLSFRANEVPSALVVASFFRNLTYLLTMTPFYPP